MNEVYEKIKIIIADIIEDYRILYNNYLDIYTLARDLKIELSQYDEKDKLFFKRSEDGFGFFSEGHYYIYYNRNKPETRINFTIGHEIGHFVLHEFFQKWGINEDDQEKYCNFFSAYILAPIPILHQLQIKDPNQLAQHFHISDDCAQNRLDNYSKWLQKTSAVLTSYEKQILDSQIRPHIKLQNTNLQGLIKPDLLEGAQYTPEDEYPIIDPFHTSDKMPDNIIPFSKVREVRNKIEDYFICFYCEDTEFEKVRKNPQKYLNLFAQSDGIIGFDFSVHTDMPKIEQQHQMFLNQALSYYYGKMGIPIIPNIRYGDLKNIGDYLKSIPRNIFVSIGTHGQIKTTAQKKEWMKCIKLIVEELDPEGIVVYGPHPDEVFKQFEDKGVVFRYFDPWRPPLHQR